MSDDESSPGSAVAASDPPSASTTAINRSPLPQIKTTSSTQLGGLFGEKVETVETNLAQVRYCVEKFSVKMFNTRKLFFSAL